MHFHFQPLHLKPQHPVNKCCHLSLVTVSALGYTRAWLNYMHGSAINYEVSSPLYCNHPSIHSLSYTFCESGYSNRLCRVIQTSLSPATLFGSSWGILRQFHLRDPEMPPGQIWYISPPTSSGCTTGSPPGSMCLLALQRETVRRYSDEKSEPPKLAWCKGAPDLLWYPSGCWISSSKPRNPTDAFWLSTMEMLFLISVTLNLAGNHPSVCWWLQADAADRTKSSANNRDTVLMFPTKMPSSAWLAYWVPGHEFQK